MKRLSAFAAALVICSAVLTSCSVNTGEKVMSIKDGDSISVNYMCLLTAMQKSMYAGMINTYGNDWDAVVNEKTGETFADMLKIMTVNYAKSSLICEYMHDKVYNLSLTDAQKSSLDKQMSALVKNAGSEQAFEEKLSTYGADSDSMRRYLEISIKQSNMYNYFYGDGGVSLISEDSIKDYFKKNYSIVTHIYFSAPAKTKDDGTVVSPSDEEKIQKKQLADEVYNRILAGESFYDLKAQYNEDTYESDYYPNGFFVTNDGAFPAEFTSAAMDMSENEYRLVESTSKSGYSVHIICKLPMNEQLYNTDKKTYSAIKETLEANEFNAKVGEYSSLIASNTARINEIDPATVPAFEVADNK